MDFLYRSGGVREVDCAQKFPAAPSAQSISTGGELLTPYISQILGLSYYIQVEAWRPVIHLNLVRSVNFIVNLILSRNQGRRDSLSDGQRKSSSSANIGPELRKLCIRLAPLRQVEDSLIKSLWGDAPPKPNNGSEVKTQAFGPASISLPTGYSWKKALGLHKASMESLSSSSTRSTRSVDGQNRRILAALGDDIFALWDDSGVQNILQTAEINLKEHPGLYVLLFYYLFYMTLILFLAFWTKLDVSHKKITDPLLVCMKNISLYSSKLTCTR